MKNVASPLRILAAATGMCLLAGSFVPALGQPGSGGPTPAAVTETPIDGGASLLLAAGAAYGLKCLRTAKLARAEKRR